MDMFAYLTMLFGVSYLAREDLKIYPITFRCKDGFTDTSLKRKKSGKNEGW